MFVHGHGQYRAGKATKYFDIKAERRKAVLIERKNARLYSDNMTGMFVMLRFQNMSKGLIMAIYDGRRFTVQAFDTKKSADHRFRTGNSVTPMAETSSNS